MKLLIFSLFACGGGRASSPDAAGAATSGWIREEGWSGDCFQAPDLSTEKARLDTLNALALQWRGGRNDGVSFPTDAVAEVRDLLVARSDKIPAIAEQNYTYCAQVMGQGASTVAWGNWLSSLPPQLQAGECVAMVEEDRYEYLDISQGWQLDQPLCAGEIVKITASTNDRFRLSAEGPWINVEGDPEAPVPAGAPCEEEGCLSGMLLGRFAVDGGAATVFPIGPKLSFTAPASGTLSLSLNDDSFGDNAWYISGDYADKTSITFSPGS